MLQDSPESRKALFRKLVDLYAAGDISALDQIVAPNYVGHPSAGDRDLEGLRQSILYFHKLAYSDEVDRAFRRQGDEASGMMPIALGAKRR